MVRDLARIDEDEVFFGASHHTFLFGRRKPLRKSVGFLLHVVGQVLRVGTRVGEQLLFV